MGQCPSSFVPYQGACVRQCPTNLYEFVTDNNQPRCVARIDRDKKVLLTHVAAILPTEPGKPTPTMEMLERTDPVRYQAYKAESDRVDAALAILQTELDKQQQINDAFSRLQQAENIRDQAPQAYQQARNDYYSLVQGPSWLNTEKERIKKAEVEPEINRYRAAYDSLKTSKDSQQRTQEVMNAVKDGVLTMKDDFKYTTGIFKEQIDNLRNQINIERRGREKIDTSDTGFYKWVDALLNLFIVVGLVFAAYVFWKKFRPSPSPTYAPVAVTP